MSPHRSSIDVNVRDAGLSVHLESPTARPQVVLDRRKVLFAQPCMCVKLPSHEAVPIAVRVLWLGAYCAQAGAVEVEDVQL